MKNTISLDAFRDFFEPSDGFSYDGLEIIFNHLEEVDPDSEVDPVATRCEFSEYTAADLVKEYEDEIAEQFEDEIEEDDDLGLEDFAFRFIEEHDRNVAIGTTADSIVFIDG